MKVVEKTSLHGSGLGEDWTFGPGTARSWRAPGPMPLAGDTVAEPVLWDIGLPEAASADAEVPRLYWCQTGHAVFLPLHAADHHSEPSPSVPRTVIDRTESVYIPKLRALRPLSMGADRWLRWPRVGLPRFRQLRIDHALLRPAYEMVT